MVAVLLSSCNKVPISGRNQLNLVSDSEVLQSSLASYREYISKAPLSNQTVQSEQVTRVGRKIAAATESYLNSHGMSDQVKNFAWEFNLVRDSQLNAFCMPGGKIVVYEGIMNIIGSDDELAVVLGHEVAHAVAKHSTIHPMQLIFRTGRGTQAINRCIALEGCSLQSCSRLKPELEHQLHGRNGERN